MQGIREVDLKTDNKLALSQRHEHVGHMCVTRRRDEAATQLVSSSGIKASSDDNQIWVKVVGHRHDDMLKGKHIIRVAHTFCGPRNVDILSLASTCTTVKVVAIRSSWIEPAVFVNVYRNIQYIRVRVESLLNAVAMMNVPVHNENLPANFLVVNLADLGGNSNVVKHAKSHWAIFFCMVPWWPDDGDGILQLPTCDSPASLDSATSGQQCRLPGQLIEIDRVEMLFYGEQFVVLLICSIN